MSSRLKGFVFWAGLLRESPLTWDFKKRYGNNTP